LKTTNQTLDKVRTENTELKQNLADITKKQGEESSSLSNFYSFDRFESSFAADVSSFMMLKNPKPVEAKAAPSPAAPPAKGKKGKK
jgi:hypothetical protein